MTKNKKQKLIIILLTFFFLGFLLSCGSVTKQLNEQEKQQQSKEKKQEKARVENLQKELQKAANERIKSGEIPPKKASDPGFAVVKCLNAPEDTSYVK